MLAHFESNKQVDICVKTRNNLATYIRTYQLYIEAVFIEMCLLGQYEVSLLYSKAYIL